MSWRRPATPIILTADLADDFAALGVTVPDELIETPEESDDMFGVLPANWPAMTAFLACETQWRMVPFATRTVSRMIRTGLDYAALDVVLRRRGAADEVFGDVCEIEAGALEAFAEMGASEE